MNGVLHIGDNLEVMKSMESASVDLVYADPPFNTGRDFLDFNDKWGAGDNFTAPDITALPLSLRVFLPSVRALHGVATYNYLCFMAVRLAEMHRVLKHTGSLYLHCDPIASHYLKLVLDGIFGGGNYRNEIVWRRTNGGKGTCNKKFPASTDSILFYVKSKKSHFYPVYNPQTEENLSYYKYDDNDGRGLYRRSSMNAPAPSSTARNLYEWKGFKPHPNGWSCRRETMEKRDEDNEIVYPRKPDGSFDHSRRPTRKSYLKDKKGILVHSIWIDINRLNSMGKERVGYPTQKPVELLERIIKASSVEGDMVFDPFCGSGTTLVAAERLNRRWIGVDINEQARELLNRRLA